MSVFSANLRGKYSLKTDCSSQLNVKTTKEGLEAFEEEWRIAGFGTKGEFLEMLVTAHRKARLARKPGMVLG